MNNLKNFLSVVIALAMLVTFTTPAWAEGENLDLSKLTVRFTDGNIKTEDFSYEALKDMGFKLELSSEDFNADEEKDAEKEKDDQADNKEAVGSVLEAVQAQDNADADKKAVENAKKEAEEAQEKATEAAKDAQRAKEAAANAAADAKEAKEAEEKAQKEFEDAKSKEEEAQRAADADPSNDQAKKTLEEAKKAADAAEKAQQKAKKTADDAAQEAEKVKEIAKNVQDAAEKAQKEADEKAKEAKDLEDKLAPTDLDKNGAIADIDHLPSLSPAEKNEFKSRVDQAKTKAEIEAAVEAARAKDAENKNKQQEPQPQPQPGGKDKPDRKPETPHEPHHTGDIYDHNRDYTRRNEKPVEKKEVKEEKKEETKEDKKEPAVQKAVKPISVMAPSLPVNLTDIPAGEEGEAIRNMVARGVLKGTSKDKFEPQTTITRSMVTEVFMRIAADKNIDNTLEFADVKHDDWYNNSVKWAASKNIIKGFEDGSFKPAQKVTAQEFAVMMERMLSEYKIDMPFIKTVDMDKYQNLQDWSKKAVIKMIEQGLIGESDEPIETREITRTELAKALDIIIKFIELQ